jgi:hypothetical protein
MPKVFVCSVPNLAAAASGDVHGGLYHHRDPAMLNGCDIPCFPAQAMVRPASTFASAQQGMGFPRITSFATNSIFRRRSDLLGLFQWQRVRNTSGRR